ncbi:citrate lyase subunit beta / citryl-CoA lyase [Pseudovibrio ascidiaceicola]|uniref:Citrate lyase subunit beta / citryl-CoA lyase n=1 Tax=Pseudovibrio ascidiaceicola TaxID=285279 RepID=A0A1I4CML1_9HYPH|nr:citrate lyase subunit beta [Pseudovibrio ascidiaceicola]SFK81171.1 citrate lyase subunit beta / citryl-CoA lyase [Pseudovibrio ascidiaceicola]
MNSLLSVRASTFDKTEELKALRNVSLAILPEKPVSEFEPYGPSNTLAELGKHHNLYLMLNEPSESTILSMLKPYAHVRSRGVIPTFVKSRADIERLHAILSVFEAEHALQDCIMKIIPELGRYPVAFHNLMNLSDTSPRLTALTWNEEALKETLDAKQSRDENRGLLPPFQYAQTQCLFAAKSAHLIALDTAPTATPEDLEKSTALGFTGMNANTPEDAQQIQQVFSK